MSKPILTQERLKSLFDYNPETGVFTWKTKTSNRVRVGDVVGCDDGAGYLQTTIAGIKYRLHRLAIFYMTGIWPPEYVDHINRIRHDNRISNLRPATRAENSHNKCKSSASSSGYIGVSWRPDLCKWEARIAFSGRQKVLGYFATPKLASGAYQAAKRIYHPTAPVARLGA